MKTAFCWNRSTTFASECNCWRNASISTFWVQFSQQLEQAQKQRAGMQQTDGQGTTQNLEAMLHWMVRSQQHKVQVHDGSGASCWRRHKEWSQQSNFGVGSTNITLETTAGLSNTTCPTCPSTATPPGEAPPSTGLVNLSTESTGTGGVETIAYTPLGKEEQQGAMYTVRRGGQTLQEISVRRQSRRWSRRH